MLHIFSTNRIKLTASKSNLGMEGVCYNVYMKWKNNVQAANCNTNPQHYLKECAHDYKANQKQKRHPNSSRSSTQKRICRICAC